MGMKRLFLKPDLEKPKKTNSNNQYQNSKQLGFYLVIIKFGFEIYLFFGAWVLRFLTHTIRHSPFFTCLTVKHVVF